MNWNASLTVLEVKELLLDFSFAEERLAHLGRAIFRGTWNSRVLSELEELNNSLELSVSTWRELKERLFPTLNIARRRIQTLSVSASSQEDIKGVELILIKWEILLRAGRLLVRFLWNMLGLLFDTAGESNGALLSSLSHGITQRNLSGDMARLDREKVEQLFVNLKTFMENESPGFPTALCPGLMDTIRDARELFWTNLMGPPSCPTYYVCWIDTHSRCLLRAGLSNGDLASSGSPLSILLDGITLWRTNGEHSADGLLNLDRLFATQEVNVRRSQETFGPPLPPLDIMISPSTEWVDLDELLE